MPRVLNNNTLIHKNIFNRYEHNTNITMSKFLDVVSEKLKVIYKGVKMIYGKYFIVTVTGDLTQVAMLIKFYNPKICRAYTAKLLSVDLEQYGVLFFDAIYNFVINDFNGGIKNY